MDREWSIRAWGSGNLNGTRRRLRVRNAFTRKVVLAYPTPVVVGVLNEFRDLLRKLCCTDHLTFVAESKLDIWNYSDIFWSP